MHRSRPGFLLVEALLGVAVFALVAVGAYRILLVGQGGSVEGGNRIRATLLSERAIEAAKSIRDTNFSDLTVGTHGVAVGAGGTWVWSGSQITTSDGYTTKLTVSSLASNWVSLEARTTWSLGVNGSGSVTLYSDLTDWRSALGGNWMSVSLEGSYINSGTPLFNDVAIYGNYAFASSETFAGGAGLYVLDITALTAPERIQSSFSLGAAGYDVAVRGSRLYVVNGNSSSELQVYDVSAPASFSSSNLITSYNLPGTSLGRSLAIHGTTLYLGATESSTSGNDELYVFDISNSGSIVLQDSLDDASSINDIAIRGTTAYLASTMDTSELRVVDVTTPTNIALLGGYSATDVQDGYSVIAFGTGTVLGRVGGSAISELMKFTVGASAVPTTPPGPWYREMGGDLAAATLEPAECAAFFATTNTTKEMQVVNVHGTALGELASYDSSSGDGRGIFYDSSRDRVFLLTNKGVLIFKPATGSWTCP